MSDMDATVQETAAMTYQFDLAFALWALAGLVLGLIIGNATWGRSARRNARAADNVALAAAAAAARTEAAQTTRELTASREAMRPLADEVDRLKRELAKAKRPATLPFDAAGSPSAVAAAEGITAAPDIRQLKGVGDKFAAALEAIGLTSIDRIARLAADEATDADTRLGAFNGRIARDRLVEQATLLDEGRTTEYAARFGTL